jgi:hypothetical protein
MPSATLWAVRAKGDAAGHAIAVEAGGDRMACYERTSLCTRGAGHGRNLHGPFGVTMNAVVPGLPETEL